ncbi:acyltransferase family protein [Corynebacterium gerontici]|uniref:acyltransferase family protein n=1 Tax=Corynebacterium gerontici TaxID=2079234 RepID=UPI0013DDD376|nr:acyltransferase family protein [Corynebacterium gerontici]
MSQTLKPRMAWPDVAKGLSILGVVLLHITLAVPEGDKTFAAEANELIAPLRMPLFFLVSGFFSLKVLGYRCYELFTKRIWFLAVPYVIWAPIEIWLKHLEWHVFLDKPMPDREYLVESVVESSNMYWFLHSLVLFTVVLWACKFVPPWARWLIFGLILFAAPLLPYPPLMAKVATYLPCFLFGAFARPWITRFAEQAFKPWALVLGLMSYFGARELLMILAGTEDPYVAQVMSTVATLLHLPGGIILVVGLAKIPLLGEMLQRIGRHTLIIYISHPIALTVIFGYYFRYRDGGIGLDATGLMGHTNTWILLCIPVTVFGAFAFQFLSKVPVIGWTIFPPHIDHLVAPIARRWHPGDAPRAGTPDARQAGAQGQPSSVGSGN